MDEIFPRWFCECGRGSREAFCRCGKKRPVALRSGRGSGAEGQAPLAPVASTADRRTAPKGWTPELPVVVIHEHLDSLRAEALQKPRLPPKTKRPLTPAQRESVAMRLRANAVERARRAAIDAYLDELAKAAE